MSVELILTIIGFVVVAGIGAFAVWRVRQPAKPLDVRLIDYNYVVIPAIVALLILGVRMAILISGHH